MADQLAVADIAGPDAVFEGGEDQVGGLPPNDPAGEHIDLPPTSETTHHSGPKLTFQDLQLAAGDLHQGLPGSLQVAPAARLYPDSRAVGKGTGMGNSAWGNGYHQGLTDGLAQGLAEGKKGRAIVAGASIVGGLVVAGAAFGYREFKARSFAKRVQELSVEDSDPVAGEGVGDEHEASEGITSK
ncbi:hypothetical protein [Micromonospora rubida]|uniref:hypothetical protein n=1 Tax=Micromonospora rubida TaxID=2697657 RepID=UPI001378BDFD|nr:hypothetical protein [Micromonospora rubida]NBE80369.1 hypothetical protein [Micromonospora rubida]